ncbi:MAG: SDR family NAD(P)-dependent oxidoreductase [Hespellia sp.]|nr:SDR family NAD(P)-dependent oxidoreductase [Hespellia sp.]
MDLTKEFEGKVVVISGGSRGIGLATVKKLLGYGAKVCFLSHYEETGKKAMDELMAINPDYEVMTFHPDLCDYKQVKEMYAAVEEKWGKVDVLINNAGVDSGIFLSKMKKSDWNAVMDVNINAMFTMCKYGVEHMYKKKGGAIVNTASVAGVYGSSMGLPYPVSKAAVIGLTKSLAGELAPFKIRVNAVAPGVVDTDMVAGLNDIARKSIGKTIPLGRMAEADELANAICFLASGAASYITGTVLQVDGAYRPANTMN